jgi:hypothetical protein
MTAPTDNATLRAAQVDAVFRAIHGADADPFHNPEGYDYAETIVAALAAAIPPEQDGYAEGRTYEVDDRGLFCRHCGRTSCRHHRVIGGGNFCDPVPTDRHAEGRIAGLEEELRASGRSNYLLQTDNAKMAAALRAYVTAYDAGTGTIHVHNQVRDALGIRTIANGGTAA